MGEVSIIGIDLAKNSFQVHGAGSNGPVAFRSKLTRAKVLPYLAAQPDRSVAMEACAGAHHWGRASTLSHFLIHGGSLWPMPIQRSAEIPCSGFRR